jgi:hypothetical protein
MFRRVELRDRKTAARKSINERTSGGLDLARKGYSESWFVRVRDYGVLRQE